MSRFSDYCVASEVRPLTLLDIATYAPPQIQADGLPVWNTLAFNTLPFGSAAIQDETLVRVATAAYVTQAGDDPANTRYMGLTLRAPSIVRALPLSPQTSRRVNASYGAMELVGAGDRLDAAINAGGIDGRDVVLREGEAGWPLSDFGITFAGAGVVWWRDGARVMLTLRDKTYRLEKRLQRDFYAGSGGAEGGADLAGLPRPMGFGLVQNAPAVPVDRAAGIWQVHLRSINAVLGVYEAGAAITASGADYADYAALEAASVAPGQYATCKALGLVKLGSQPTGLLTVDFEGDAVGGYVNTAAAIARRLLVDFGSIDGAELDDAAFTAVAAADPAVIGWWRGTEPLALDAALDAILAGSPAVLGATREGAYTLYLLRGPDGADSAFSFTQGVNLSDISRLQPPDQAWPPPFRIEVGWSPVEYVQAGDGLAGSASQARLDLVRQASRYEPRANSVTRVRFPLSPAWRVESRYAYQAAAQARATALLNEFGGGVRLYSASINVRRGYLLDLGMGGRVTAPSLGLNDAPARIVALNEQPDAGLCHVSLWVAQ